MSCYQHGSMDWFKGQFTGKPHDLTGKINMVSGEDFPLNQSIGQIITSLAGFIASEVPRVEASRPMYAT